MDGENLVLEGPTSDDDWVAMFHSFRESWPEAVIHRLSHGEAVICRDPSSVRDEPRASVHVSVVPGRLTVVVCREDCEARRVGLAVFHSVRGARVEE